MLAHQLIKISINICFNSDIISEFKPGEVVNIV
jgi:hypothetical protein